MPQTNIQFSVAAHVMAALGARGEGAVHSAVLAASVNADPSFVRRVVSKLAKAGLVTTTRGKHGACALARPASKITMLDIYRASEAPAPCVHHAYPVAKTCRVSRNIGQCMDDVLAQAQAGFERSLEKQTLAAVLRTLQAGA